MNDITFYDYLNNTINVLVIEDEDVAFSLVNELLSSVPMLKIHRATRCSEALLILRETRIHLCILDLGIADVNNDEFYVVRNYANKSAVIVLTASTSPSKGADAIALGARAVLEKKAPFNNRLFLESADHYALLNIVNSHYRESSGDTLSLATKILFEKKPVSVTEWADYLRITDRQLRNLWDTGIGTSAKYILFLFHLYSKAIKYYESRFFSQELPQDVIPNSTEYKKTFEYYNSHKKELSSLIS